MPFLVATNSTLERSQRRKRLDRRRLALQLFRKLAELLHLASIDRLEQGLARGEVAVEGADANPGASRHRFEARIPAAGAEDRFRRLQHALAVAHRVDAGLARRLYRGFSHISLISPSLPLEKSEDTSICLLQTGGYLRIS